VSLQRVLIVGCGQIAGGFDASRPPALPPLTHAGAYRRHGSFEIAACVEPDAERRAAFMHRWGVAQGFASVPEAAAAGPFDVVSLCSPTALHAAQFDEVLAMQPRLVFCEKPLTPTLARSERLVAHGETAGVPLAVNHTRRWAPDIWRLADELAAGDWGTLRSAVGTYNKGVLNNGSHLIDLLHMLLRAEHGPLRVLAAGPPVADHWADDPTIPALLQTESGVPIHLHTAHAADYAVFELQLTTSEAVITMEDGGSAWRIRRVVPSAAFAGYRVLDAGERTPGRYAEATLAAITNLHDTLTNGAPLLGTGCGAVAAQRVCEQIRRLSEPSSNPARP